MHARVFFRITLSLKRLSKTIVFCLLFSLTFFTVRTNLFAQVKPEDSSPCGNVTKEDRLYYFKTLFCTLDSTAQSSGFINGTDGSPAIQAKMNATTDPGGIIEVNFLPWLVMDGDKNLYGWWKGVSAAKNRTPLEPSAWFYSYVHNESSDPYIVRIQYTDKDGKAHTEYQTIKTEKLWDKTATIGAAAEQSKFFYFQKYDASGIFFGNSKQEVIGKQQIRTTFKPTTPIKYGSEIKVDLWYKGDTLYWDQKLGSDSAGLTSNVNWPSRQITDTSTNIGGEKTPSGEFYVYNPNTNNDYYYQTIYPSTTGQPDGLKQIGCKTGCINDAYMLQKDDNRYFKIGETVTYKIPPNYAAALNDAGQTAAGVTEVIKQDANGGLPECGIVSGSVLGCVAQIIYGLIFKPISWIAALFGYLFDFFIGYSVSDESYRFAFVNTGWQLVRDIANIFFIIILVWTGFSTVFSIGGISMKKVVPTLVINALIINFSLFGTRVVIDLSNVVARVFYNQLGVCSTKDCSPDPTTGKVEYKRGIGGYWPLSEKIVSSFNPQTILSSSTLSSSGTETTASTTDKSAGTATSFGASTSASNGTINTGSLESGNNMSLSSSEYAGYFIIVTLIGAAIMFAIALMFWGVSFMFLGRVVGLYICMIFSPFAFLSRGKLPLISGIRELTWDSWVKELTSYAMLAPIFIFFLYIVYSFLQTDFLNEFGLTRSDHSFFENVLYITIPMLIIYTLIKQAAGIAKEYGGKIGNAVQNGVNGFVGGVGGIVGGGVGIAAGGAALLGRNVIGRGMTAIGSIKGKDGKTNADRWAANANNGFFNRQLNNFYNKSQTGSFDARNLGLGIKINGKEATLGGTFNKTMDTAGKDLGISMSDKFSKKLGVGQDKAGGIQKIDKARVEARQKKNDAKLDFSAVSDGSAGSTWSTYRDTKAQKAASEKWQDKIDEEPEIKNAPQQAVIKQQQEYQKQMEQQLQNTNLTPDQRSGMESRLANSKEVEQKAHLKLVELKNDIIERLKKDPSASAAFAAAKKEEENRLAQYGPIKNKKAFEAAMRAEYAENLKANSLWMTEGERAPLGTAIGTLAGTLGVVAPGLVGTISTAVGIDLAGGAIDQIGNIHLKAADATIKAAQKQTGTTAAKIQAKIDMYENTLKEAIKSIPGNEHLDADNIKIDDPQHDLKRAVATNVAKLETEIEKDEAIIKNPSSSDADKITARVANEERRASIKELREAIKERDIQKEKLEKYNNDEESKKKKEGGDEKPAEPKK